MLESLPEPVVTTRRLNIRAAIVLVILTALATGGAVALHARQNRGLRITALAMAHRLVEEGKIDLAIRHLNALLQLHPNDFEATSMKAALLAVSARTVEQILDAAVFNDQFVRGNPDAADSQEARRRTADLYIRYSDLYQDSSYYRMAPLATASNMQYRAAAAVARMLIDRGAKDAGANLLLARALEGLGRTGDLEMLGEAVGQYQKTLKNDPANLVAAERLANLLNDRKNDPTGAIAVLDELAKHRPDSSEVRLVRHRFFVRLGREDRALAEMEAAIKFAPHDSTVCLEAADLALRRGRTADARGYFDRISAEDRNGLKARLVLGLIELNENHPEAAIDIWRKGLISSQGSDAMLTWNLAFSLLELGRMAEAGPLIAQYRRFMADDSSPMLGLLLAIQEQKTGQSFKAALRLEGLRERIDPRWGQMVDFTLGRCYVETGDATRAALAFRRVLQENPRSVPVRVELADVLTSTRPHGAADIIEKGLQFHPNDPSLWVALASAQLRQQENLAAATRTWDTFDQTLAKAVELAPNHPSLPTIRSRRQSLDGKTDNATVLLEEALRREPRQTKLWETYIETLLRADRLAEALDVLERASAPGAVGDTVGIRLAQFRVLKGLGRAREARERLTRDVNKILPDQRDRIWAVLGRDLVSQGDLAGARDVYTGWARQVPDDLRPRLALLDLSLSGNETDDRAAADALRRLGGPDDAAVRLIRASDLIRSTPEGHQAESAKDGRLREAERILETVRAEASESAAFDMIQGDLFERQGLFGEAAQAYRRAWGKGSEEVLPRLVDLLARRNPGELEQIATQNSSPRLIRLAVQACMRLRQVDRATRIVASDPGPAEPPEARAWRIELLERLGKPDRVEEALRAETTRRPEAAEPWIALIRFLTRQGRSNSVAPILGEARRGIKDERTAFVEARLCWAAGDRAGADRWFQASLTQWPDDIEILLAASDHDQEAGRTAEMERLLRRILVVNPGHRGASRRLATLLTSQPLDKAGWEKAWAVLGPESAGTEDPEDRLVRAVLLSKRPGPDSRQRATDLLESLLADLPGDSRVASTARGLLARILLETGQADRTLRLIGPRVDQGNGNAPDLALYTEALLATGHLEQARLQIDRLATIAPGDDREARLRARLIAARARPGEAAKDLERAWVAMGETPGAATFGREAFTLLASVNPPINDIAERFGLLLASRNPGWSWMPALIAGRQGRVADALRLCRAAAEVAEPADAREASRIAFAVAFHDAGNHRWGELESVLEAASRRDPEGTDIPLQLAQLRHRQGQYEEVVRLYRQIITRRPDLRASIQNNIAWVLSENLHRPDEAIKIVDELLQDQDRSAAILDTRGVILTRLARPVEAIQDLEESLRIGPDPVHWFHLARAYRNAGKTEDFVRSRNQARQAGLTAEMVEPSERAELISLMKP